MIYVPGKGPNNAKLAIVGEAPGLHEERLGYPFAGPTGEMVNDLLSGARDRCYLTNVVKVRPPDNDIKKLHLLGRKINDFIPQLQEELNLLRPNAILAFGGTALEALTGYKGIEKYRGSILPSILTTSKVIATIHPASLMHKESEGRMKSWKDLTFIKWDVQRALAQSEFPGIRRTERNLIVARSSLDFWRFRERYAKAPFVAVDIETFRTIPICIAFAFNSREAISVPLFFGDITASDRNQLWKDVADLMADDAVKKIGQNWKFDETQLEYCVNHSEFFGIQTRAFFFDTMLAFQTLYPELPAKLAFQTSVLTEEPYYKDEGKEYNPKKDKFDRLLLYNAKDAVVTYECFERELEELESRRMDDFFFSRVMPLHAFYRRIEGRGILRDNIAKDSLEEKYKDKLQDLQDELDVLTADFGPINANSPKQVAQLIYIGLKIPARKGTDEKTLDALMRNVVKDKTKRRILELILEIRKVRKTLGTYINAETHPDGRLRTGYRIILETGRTSTSVLKPPVTTRPMGLAFQTITKHGEVGNDLRRIFVPDPGYVFIEPDLSQAEARVVAVLAKDERLLKMFKYGVDIHRVTAGWIWDRTPDLNPFFNETDEEKIRKLVAEINAILKREITEDERQIGKMFRHAGNLGIEKRTAGENAGVSEWRAGQILTKFHATNPNIRGIFHAGIVEFLWQNQRTLTNPFGRTRQFLNKWGEELFKEAYAQIPQSTVSDQTKFAMQRIEARARWVEILQESHDSFLAQIPKEAIGDTLGIIKEELERPIDFSLCSLGEGTLIIPCEIKLGDNWEEMQKAC